MTAWRGLGTGFAIVAAVGLGGGWTAAASAATETGGGPHFTPAEMVGALHRLNQMGIEAGRMAQQRGRTAAMKHYGATLEHDHAAADERLEEYTRRHHVDLNTPAPIGISGQMNLARHELDNLQNLGGGSFDRQFAELMVRDYQKAIVMVDHARSEIADAQLKAMLGEVESNLREHEQIASSLRFEDSAAPPPVGSGPRATGH